MTPWAVLAFLYIPYSVALGPLYSLCMSLHSTLLHTSGSLYVTLVPMAPSLRRLVEWGRMAMPYTFHMLSIYVWPAFFASTVAT